MTTFTLTKQRVDPGKTSMVPAGYTQSGRDLFTFNASDPDSLKQVEDIKKDVVPGVQLLLTRGLTDYLRTSEIVDVTEVVGGLLVKTQTSLYLLEQHITTAATTEKDTTNHD
jgi:hypothetical protein